MTNTVKLNTGLKSTATISAAVMLYCLAGTSLASAQGSKWCQAISGGVFCADQKPTPPNFCGTKQITLALADGTAQNPWRQLATAAAINEASQCPNVTAFDHTDGQGNTQKAISDITSLAARGTNAIVVFPDAGPAVLPAIRDAFKQGATIIPYRAKVGGQEGKDYSMFVGFDLKQEGIDWGNWLAKAMDGKGKLVYLGGPAGTSQSIERGQGLAEALKNYPGIEQIGQVPFEVTNWDADRMGKALTALIARYPTIDGVMVDASYGVLTSGAFQRAGRPLPKIAGEDVNSYGCTWKDLHKDGKENNFQYTSNSSASWTVRLAIRWAIATAAGGKMDQPLTIKGPDGTEHVVAGPGEKIVKNFKLDDSLEGKVFCNPKLPDTASNSTSLTDEQVLAALKGGL
jgi:ribose transport system substrate-binding protein